jgi:hypothetical protein
MIDFSYKINTEYTPTLDGFEIDDHSIDGIEKLAQQWLRVFLTPCYDDLITGESIGTKFANIAISGVVDVSYLESIIYEAVDSTNEQVMLAQSEDKTLEEDEILSTAELIDYNIINETNISLQIRVISLSGESIVVAL